jgi:hypothetical protein
MKSKKGMLLLLLFCGHALVGAELRGTAARMRDPELNNEVVKSHLGTDTNSIPNTRTLQSALCMDWSACVFVFGGLDFIPPEARCCPGPDGVYKTCCGHMTEDERYDPPTGVNPTIPFPTGTMPAPTVPEGTRTDVPGPTATIPVPAPTTPKVDASCLAYPACVDLFGGADKVTPGSMCCPTPYGQRMSCCDA